MKLSGNRARSKHSQNNVNRSVQLLDLSVRRANSKAEPQKMLNMALNSENSGNLIPTLDLQGIRSEHHLQLDSYIPSPAENSKFNKRRPTVPQKVLVDTHFDISSTKKKRSNSNEISENYHPFHDRKPGMNHSRFKEKSKFKKRKLEINTEIKAAKNFRHKVPSRKQVKVKAL